MPLSSGVHPPGRRGGIASGQMGQPSHSSPAALTRPEKEALLAANQDLLVEDLWEARLAFASRPRVVHMQFSNFCNMSCTMCYDGVNPPLRKMPEEAVRRLAADLLPTASVLVPFAGSEPLIVTWDLTRDLCRSYGVELDLITNAQYLDEERFAEVEPHVSTITFSIDSHLRDVYERIRLRSKPDKVFRNLPVAARLCREHGIEPVANVVFLVENAPSLEQTTEFMAEAGITTVRFLQFDSLPGASPERGFSDALRHFSPTWIARKKEQIKAAARAKSVRVIFDFFEAIEVHDHRPADLAFRPNGKAQPLLERLVRFLPGYCWQALDSLKVATDGSAYPCCKGDGAELRLGNVFEQGFAAVWNGPESQDLRRGMLTGDVPRACRDCSFHTAWILPEQERLPFFEWARERCPSLGRPEVCDLEVSEPRHMLRCEEPPLFRWDPLPGIESYVLALALGGEFHPENALVELPGDASEHRPSAELWASLRANMGLWWALWAVPSDPAQPLRRSRAARCLIRHTPIPRVAGSTLYALG